MRFQDFLNNTKAISERVEAHGVKGLNSTPWRKVFRNEETMKKWAEQNDAEIHGTRDPDGNPDYLGGYGPKKHN